MICANCNVHEARDDNEADRATPEVIEQIGKLGVKLPTCQHCADRAGFAEMNRNVERLASALSEEKIKNAWILALTVLQNPKVVVVLPEESIKMLAHMAIVGLGKIIREKRS